MQPFFKQLMAAIGLSAMATPVEAAPQQLMNKTISVAFSVSIPARKADGTALTTNRQSSRLIYVSSQGRLFVKVMRRVRELLRTRRLPPAAATTCDLSATRSSACCRWGAAPAS